MRPARWGSGFLRCGIDPGAASAVCFAAPSLAVFGFAKRSLRSHARIDPCAQPSDVARGSRSRAAVELTLILLSGEEHIVVGFDSVVGLPLTPALSPRRGSRFVRLSESEFDSVSQVGVALPNISISSLSFRERARVRGLLIWFVILLWLWLLIFCPIGRPSVGVHQGGGAKRRAA